MKTFSEFKMYGQEEDFQKTRGGIPSGLIATSLSCRELDKANIPHVRGKIGWRDKRTPVFKNFVSARSSKGKLAKALEKMTKDEKKAIFEKAKRQKPYWTRNRERAKRIENKRREEQRKKELEEAVTIEVNEIGFLQDACYVLSHQEWDWIDTKPVDSHERCNLDTYKNKETGRIVKLTKFSMYGDGYGIDSGSIAFFPNSLQFSPNESLPIFFKGFIKQVKLIGNKYIQIIADDETLEIRTNY